MKNRKYCSLCIKTKNAFAQQILSSFTRQRIQLKIPKERNSHLLYRWKRKQVVDDRREYYTSDNKTENEKKQLLKRNFQIRRHKRARHLCRGWLQRNACEKQSEDSKLASKHLAAKHAFLHTVFCLIFKKKGEKVMTFVSL